MGEKWNEQRVLNNVLWGFDLPSIYIDHVTDCLEGIERDAYWKHKLKSVIYAELYMSQNGINQLDHHVLIFKYEKNYEIQNNSEYQKQFLPI